MTNKGKDHNKNYLDRKERRVEINEWRKLSNIILAGLTLLIIRYPNPFILFCEPKFSYIISSSIIDDTSKGNGVLI